MDDSKKIEYMKKHDLDFYDWVGLEILAHKNHLAGHEYSVQYYESIRLLYRMWEYLGFI